MITATPKSQIAATRKLLADFKATSFSSGTVGEVIWPLGSLVHACEPVNTVQAPPCVGCQSPV